MALAVLFGLMVVAVVVGVTVPFVLAANKIAYGTISVECKR